MHDGSLAVSAQRRLYHRSGAAPLRADAAQPVHHSLKQALLLIVVAVTHSGPSRMTPDFRRHEQEPQPCRRQRRVPQRHHVRFLFPVEEQATRSILARPYWWLPSFEAFARKQWYPPLSPDKPRRSVMPVVGSNSGCTPASRVENECR